MGSRLGEDLDMWFRIGLYYKYAYSTKICSIYHYYQAENACSIAVPNRLSPLCLSLLKLKKNSDVNHEIKSKAIKYLSHDLAEDIQYIFLKGYRGIAQHRLKFYREQFGCNLHYIRLCLINIIPRFILSLIVVLRSKLVRCLLKLKHIQTEHN